MPAAHWKEASEMVDLKDQLRNPNYANSSSFARAYMTEAADRIAALEAQLAEAKAERDEYYARGFGLRSHVVRYLNRNISKETLRDAFSDWESASGTRFSISPAALEATPAPMVTATHRHKKRGTEYVLLGFGKMQARDWVDHGPELDYDAASEEDCVLDLREVDMREVAIYRSIDDGSLWVRPREEFEDGRFEALTASEAK